MDKNDLDLLFQYNRWANALVREASRGLSPEEIHAPAQCSFGSLMGTLAHIYSAERIWRLRLEEGKSLPQQITGKDFPSLEDLEPAWLAEESAMQNFIAGLAEGDLSRWVEYTSTTGKLQASTLWKTLVHVVTHGVQFRGEAGAVLATIGRSPGNMDFILYLRDTNQL